MGSFINFKEYISFLLINLRLDTGHDPDLKYSRYPSKVFDLLLNLYINVIV